MDLFVKPTFAECHGGGMRINIKEDQVPRRSACQTRWLGRCRRNPPTSSWLSPSKETEQVNDDDDENEDEGDDDDVVVMMKTAKMTMVIIMMMTIMAMVMMITVSIESNIVPSSSFSPT